MAERESVLQILSEIQSMPFSESLDCSEYAKILHDKYDFDIYTIFFIDSQRFFGEFSWYFCPDTIELYRYHTFCVTKIGTSAYVIDITCPNRVMLLDEFITDIIQLNKEKIGYKFVIMQGDGSSLSSQIKLNRSCQSLRSFSYKHSKEKIIGYIFVPDLKKYLVVYDISGVNNLITFAIVDQENDYDRAGILKAYYYSDNSFIGVGKRYYLSDFYTTKNKLEVDWVDDNLNKILR